MSIAPTTISIELPGGEFVQAEVQRSPRARVTRIQIGADRPLRVIVPEGASDEFAAEALRSKRDWVRRKLQVVEQSLAQANALGLDRPGYVWERGEAVPVRLADVRYARRTNGALEVPRDDATAAILRWHRQRARAYLRELVAQEATRLGMAPGDVVIRDQKTRWGSCSQNRTISLNWRLLLVPEDVARYVVVHELVHLDIPNHSKAFWRALAVACPGWRQQVEWLREHGSEIRLYAPAA